MAKLSTLQFRSRADLGAAFVVKDPLKPEEPVRGADGAPATITILGLDSAVARRFEYEARARRQAQLATANDLTETAPTADAIAEDWAQTIDKLVAITIDWSGFEDEDGAPLPCTPELARALYEQNESIAYQVLAFYYDRAGFFGASATSSETSPPTDSALTVA